MISQAASDCAAHPEDDPLVTNVGAAIGMVARVARSRKPIRMVRSKLDPSNASRFLFSDGTKADEVFDPKLDSDCDGNRRY